MNRCTGRHGRVVRGVPPERVAPDHQVDKDQNPVLISVRNSRIMLAARTTLERFRELRTSREQPPGGVYCLVMPDLRMAPGT